MRVAVTAIAAFMLFSAGNVAAKELTPDNWDEETAGKTVFLKFFAPWCGHCKRMKPDWDKLIEEYKESETVLVADVDCTADGKPLCDANGVQGFPTLKHGDPTALEDYKGGRDLSSLKKFAGELKPVCSVSNKDLCDEEGKAKIEKYEAMSMEDLTEYIEKGEKEISEAEEKFKSGVEELQKKYEELIKEKDDAAEAVKAAGLGIAKQVKAAKGKEN